MHRWSVGIVVALALAACAGERARQVSGVADAVGDAVAPGVADASTDGGGSPRRATAPPMPDSARRHPAVLPSSGAVPKERYGSCAAIGPDGRLWISHGFTSDGTRFADTVAYDFDTGTWTDETPDGDLPVNRCLHGCWWTDDGSFALYAGQTTGVTALGDRWVLTDAGWTRVEGTAPPDRNLYARARVPGATLVMGGQAIDGGFLADTWLLSDGSADARAVQVSGTAPPGRAGGELIADPARDRLLLFGGRDGDGAFADVWELSGDLP